MLSVLESVVGVVTSCRVLCPAVCGNNEVCLER